MEAKKTNTETAVKSNTSFVIRLYRKLKDKNGNLFFSPYSISTALAMTFAGSRGSTEKQMAEVLCLHLDQEDLHAALCSLESQMRSHQEGGNVQLNVANSLWPDKKYPFLPEYLALLEKYYGVSITPVDYGESEIARKKINSWVEDKTKEKIKELIPVGVIDPLTRLVLTNAIYFKGDWSCQFDKGQTQKMAFWVTPEETVSAPMMFQGREFRYSETEDLQILEMGYMGDEISFIVLLPKESSGLAQIEAALSEETLHKWTDKLWERDVQVFLPRFTMESMFRLDEALRSIGMVDAFDERRADFSGMDGKAMLYISAVLHKAFIDVNEEGSEAAAATAVVTALSYIPSSPVVFRADHPFIFLIRENHTGSILFLGRMVNPSDS